MILLYGGFSDVMEIRYVQFGKKGCLLGGTSLCRREQAELDNPEFKDRMAAHRKQEMKIDRLGL